MLKQILLLTPIYVTVFWSIILNTGIKKNHNPRFFLGKFMLFAVVIYTAHFLYFYPLPNYYAYIDPFYQYASLLVYPVYHIYFRLLTIDNNFSLKKHYYYLIAPTILFVLYSIGVFFVDYDLFKLWLFNKKIPAENFAIKYLDLISILIKITFLIQVAVTLIANYILIKKYGEKAMQYYSDMDESSTLNVRILNISMIITGISSIVLASLGRSFFSNEITGIATASIIFSSVLFTIGWLGNRQKALNPSFEKTNSICEKKIQEEITNTVQKGIMEKMVMLFQEQKIYMDNTLNIQDVAQAVGTNRTYISTLINQQYNQNFCTFVNNYRVAELEKVLKQHPLYTNQQLAESCGFGSVDSMKRAIFSKSGEKSFQKWKDFVLNSF